MEFVLAILPALAKGTLETLKVFSLTIILSLPLGLAVAFLAMSKNWLSKSITTAYIWIFRGTPLMLQLYFVYYALPLVHFEFTLFGRIFFLGGPTLDRFWAAIVTFVLNYSAYFAEIYRGGIQSIDKGQFEAGTSLGFSRLQTMQYIVLPQVVRRILPPISNEVITLVKDTALIAAIAVPELLKNAKDAANREVNPAAYAVAAVIYLLLTLVLTVISRWLEKRVSRHEQEVEE